MPRFYNKVASDSDVQNLDMFVCLCINVCLHYFCIYNSFNAWSLKQNYKI